MKMLDLSGFAMHLRNLVSGLAKAEHDALDRAAQMIKAEAMSDAERHRSAAEDLQGASRKDEESKRDCSPDGIKYIVAGSLAHVHSDLPGFKSSEPGNSHVPPELSLACSAFRKAPDVRNLIGTGFVNYLAGDLPASVKLRD